MSDPIVLASRLDLPAASALKTQLKEHAEGDLIMDLSEVKHLGALCLQVMLAAATGAVAAGRAVSVINATDRVTDQLRVMGMSPETIARGRT
ncbi:STAS domain-containing protein [Roseobacter sinensis]|uniref:STAS domain-containing protein n=1 Tax=Roseobacter sinensis TaxID=2931391 RepID=A0ABT3BEQ3_9RHOB|nr:STAS domain-containing protein [Roseobacter sp. WL0113]MCV3272061.1 STAS domain-containing protein [Roseobacter sp. WL0113]